ncbi:MAG: 4Fe-4S binding protein [Chloroflexota bacterium]
MMTPNIDKEKCNGCGLCISVCLRNGLVLVDGVVVIVEGFECDWCIQCEVVCAIGAISCPFEIVLEQ